MFLSKFIENRMNDNNDKMCLFHWNFLCENNFRKKIKISITFMFIFLLTQKLRKLEQQQELDTLLVQAVNDDFFYFTFCKINSKSTKVNLNIKVARLKL